MKNKDIKEAKRLWEELCKSVSKKRNPFAGMTKEEAIEANVYIFGFGFVKVPACSNLILTIIEKYNLHTLRISRRIVEEVRSHLSPEDFAKFIKVINILTKIDEDFVVPFEIAVKYEAKGFKPADAFIAAYTEWVGAIAGSCRDTVHRVPTFSHVFPPVQSCRLNRNGWRWHDAPQKDRGGP